MKIEENAILEIEENAIFEIEIGYNYEIEIGYNFEIEIGYYYRWNRKRIQFLKMKLEATSEIGCHFWNGSKIQFWNWNAM